MQIDIGTLVTITLAVLALIGTLLGMLYKAQQDNLKHTQARLDTCEAKIDNETAVRVEQHNEATVRLYARIEDVERELHRSEVSVQQQLGDLNTTVAAFSGAYAPRSELNQLRDEVHARRKP